MICRDCKEPVRFGYRAGSPGWLHREDKDHVGFPVAEPEYEPPPEIPAPEVPCQPFDLTTLGSRSGCKQIVNLIGRSEGWEITRATYARGPLVGARGQVLRIVDSVALKMRGPAGLDGRTPVAVALWYDMKFELAYIGYVEKNHLDPTRTNSTHLKTFIKTGEIIAVAAEDSEE